MTTTLYITKEGLERVQDEMKKLVEFRRRKVLGEDAPAILHSEEINPDYLLFQEDMQLLESRMSEYENVLRYAQVISVPPKNERHKVMVGATVTLEEVPGLQINEYTIVGSIEANPMEGKISSDSPVGKALLGKTIGEDVVINSPINVKYRIRQVRYLIP